MTEKLSFLAKFKRCAVCKKIVHKGTGTFYVNRLIHKECYEMAKIVRFRLLSKRRLR